MEEQENMQMGPSHRGQSGCGDANMQHVLDRQNNEAETIFNMGLICQVQLANTVYVLEDI